ncbi:MAG: solute carrier family 23 protein [Bacillota bacterium]|nr:solute carrier family 23 protein [Bacillota bacterium]
MKLIYDVHEKPKGKENLLFAFQQMIAIMAATLLVPIIMTSNGLPSDPAAALFGAGLGTLVYLLFTKFSSPVFLGSTFTFLGAYAASIGYGYGYWGVIIGVGFAALVYVIFAIVIKASGSAWVNKLMPAVIAGPIVTLIGLSLSGTATSWMQTNGGETYSLVTILVGLITFFAIVYSTVKGSKNMKLFPFIYGIGAGYIIALVLTLIGNAANIPVLQILSFDSFKAAFSPFTFKSIVDIPKLYIIQAVKTQGQYEPITATALANIALIYAPIAVVELAQHVGDHKNLSNIIGKDLITDPGLDKTLLGDGIGSLVGTIFGSCANTTYGESIGCVAITGNASSHTIKTAAFGCMILSFFTPFVALINSIPKCVMGGACVALYGLIAVSGLQLLSRVDLGDNRNLYVVSAILVCGIGGLALNFGHNSATGGSLISLTSLAAALIVGIITRKITGAKDDTLSSDTLSGAVEGMKNVDMDK